MDVAKDLMEEPCQHQTPPRASGLPCPLGSLSQYGWSLAVTRGKSCNPNPALLLPQASFFPPCLSPGLIYFTLWCKWLTASAASPRDTCKTQIELPATVWRKKPELWQQTSSTELHPPRISHLRGIRGWHQKAYSLSLALSTFRII